MADGKRKVVGRFAGRQAGESMTVRRQDAGGTVRAQLRKPRKDSWTVAQERLFFETLAETCNASEAARAAGKCRSGAYYRREHDAGFAARWDQAIDIGYAEIEALLMRGRNLGVALRLLAHHRATVVERRAVAMREGPGGEDAVARLRVALDEVRRRRGVVEVE
jgi:hypothetical protein